MLTLNYLPGQYLSRFLIKQAAISWKEVYNLRSYFKVKQHKIEGDDKEKKCRTC